MRISISTPVNSSPKSVFERFDKNLFLQLATPFPPVKLLRFDGCKTGDQVSLELNFIFFRQKWTSVISDFKETENCIYFIDQGVELPFFLTVWHHKHLIEKAKEGSNIVDEITFNSPWFLPEFLLFPVLWFQFSYRKPIYRRVFGG